MCDQCENSNKKFVAMKSNRRLKFWEIKSHFHCAILGTCLSMDELRKVTRQSSIVMEGRPSDYELHGIMLGQVDEKSVAARNLHKMLDRKYKRWIQAIPRCCDTRQLGEH